MNQRSDLRGKPQFSSTKLIRACHQAQMKQKTFPNTLLNHLNPQSWTSVDFHWLLWFWEWESTNETISSPIAIKSYNEPLWAFGSLNNLFLTILTLKWDFEYFFAIIINWKWTTETYIEKVTWKYTEKFWLQTLVTETNNLKS